ncbi:MAG: ASTRA complex subunit [Sclerophora amabilis]|nr:MAG: ASTRA complex subunit [Sclerophora amabilis]
MAGEEEEEEEEEEENCSAAAPLRGRPQHYSRPVAAISTTAAVAVNKDDERPSRGKKQLPTAQPVYVLRGHSAQIHAVEFGLSNAQLITGDADGWLVVWDVAIKRPRRVWKAHDGAILGAAAWGNDRIISHGRDHKLRVWQMSTASSESALLSSKVLPIDDPHAHRPQPWLLHALDVNTLNFCAFSMCDQWPPASASGAGRFENAGDPPSPILVAVPGSMDSDGINVFQLPSEKRLHVIPADTSTKTGMVMALNIFHQTARLAVVAGYESGHAMVFLHDPAGPKWERLYAHQPHSQPVLSISITPDHGCFFTSSADATIAKHPLPLFPLPQTTTTTTTTPQSSSDTNNPLLLLPPPLQLRRSIQTKHAGQQGLSVRDDGKIFATAGWDARVRVYATKSMRELAVLKWHKEGCYATAFAKVTTTNNTSTPSTTTIVGDPTSSSSSPLKDDNDDDDDGSGIGSGVSSHREPVTPATTAVQRSRNAKTQSTHWLAVGSKDGKVSLWDLY